MLVGYARVSTTDQKMDLQIDALVNAGVEEKRIFQEHVTGVKTARPELDICLRTLREGDVLVVYKLDRLGRSLKELIAIVEQLDRDGIGFKSLTENIDTTTSSGRFFFHLFADEPLQPVLGGVITLFDGEVHQLVYEPGNILLVCQRLLEYVQR